MGIFYGYISWVFFQSSNSRICMFTNKSVTATARHEVPVPLVRILSLSNSSYLYSALKQFDERN